MTARRNQWLAPLLVVLLCATGQVQGELKKVKIASGGHIVHFLPLDLAVALGYFKDEGLDPELIYLKGGTSTAHALISKQVDFSTNSIDHAFKAAAMGKDDLRMVVLMNQTPGMVLVVASTHKNKVKSIADLKGMRLGVTSKGSATNMVLAFLLSKNGISQDDVTVVKAGSSTFPPALKNGDIDGGIALEPFASAMVDGGDAFVLQRLITMADAQKAFGGPYNQAGILTRQEVIDTNPEQVQKFVNAIVRALRFIEEKTPQEIADVLSSEVTGSDKDRYIKTLGLLKDFYSVTGKTSIESATNTLEAMQFSGVLPAGINEKPAHFLTNRFVDTAQPATGGGLPESESTPYGAIALALFIGLLTSGIVSWFFYARAMRHSQQQTEDLRGRFNDAQSAIGKAKEAADKAEEAASKTQDDWLRELGFLPLAIGVQQEPHNGLTLFEDRICQLARQACKSLKLCVMTPLLHSLRKPWKEYTPDALSDEAHWAHGFCEDLVNTVKARKRMEGIELEIDFIFADDKLLRKIIHFVPDRQIADELGYYDSIKFFFSRLRGEEDDRFCQLHYCQIPETPFYFALADVPNDGEEVSDTSQGVMAFINCQDLISQRGQGRSTDEMAQDMQVYAFSNPAIIKFMARLFNSLAMQKDHTLYSLYQQCRTHNYELALTMKAGFPASIEDVIKRKHRNKIDYLLLRLDVPEMRDAE